MTITAAGVAAGNFNNDATSVANNADLNVTAGQLVVICGMKYSPSNDAFVAGDCTKSAGTATLGTIALDVSNNVNTDGGNYAAVGVWSAIVTGSGTLRMQVGDAVSGSYLLIGVEAFNGTWDSSRLEASNSATHGIGSPTTVWSSGNATSAGAALFVGCAQFNNNTSGTISYNTIGGSAPTVIYQNTAGTDDNGGSVYRIVATGTTDDVAGTTANATIGNACVAVYKEAAGGGGGGFQSAWAINSNPPIL